MCKWNLTKQFHCSAMLFQVSKLCIQDQRQNLCVIIWLLALHTSCVCHASVLEVVAVVQIHALWLQKLYVLQNACHLACMGNHVQLRFLSDGVSCYVLLLISWSLDVLTLEMWCLRVLWQSIKIMVFWGVIPSIHWVTSQKTVILNVKMCLRQLIILCPELVESSIHLSKCSITYPF